MPSARAVAGFTTALVVFGVVGLILGAVLLVANRAGGFILLVGGLGAVLGGSYVLTRSRMARTRARTTVPGTQQSSSMLPGGALFFFGVVLGFVGVQGTSWLFVPAAITGLAGMILFARSGSPDEPA